MEKETIDRILLDQQDELSAMRSERIVSRPEEKKINLKSKLAQVVIGVRRSGKSTLCFQALEKSREPYAYVNFDDERFANLKPDDLDNMLEGLYRIYGNFKYLFLDEIQNVDGWPLFVNRLLRQRLHLVITGSNAKLLSSELATHLTGRHHAIELFPFSFKEWCEAKDIDLNRLTTKNKGLLLNAFDEYLHKGGFPELLLEDEGKAYISSLFNSIIGHDIKERFKIRNIDELKKLAHHILNECPTIINVEALTDICGIKSNHTVTKYLSFLRQTYLLSHISRYSTKSRQRARNEKCYAIDVALMDKRENAFAKENLGWRLETIVYLELLRRYPTENYDIYYLKEKNSETDFIVCEGSRAVGIYQVSYDISSEKTRKREIRGCIAGANAAKCENIFLITNNESGTIEAESHKIHILPAYQWLTEK